MQTNKQFILAGLLGLTSSLVMAEPDSSDIEITVVTPRIEQPLSKTLSSTTVFTADDIRASQAPDVPTLLRNTAGVEISQNGGVGKTAALFLRGSDSTHVLVLIDGVRVNSATLGTTEVDQLMLDQIDHIEVARGNLSSLYGSEAIGGVVQIFTKRGKGAPAANVSAGVGSQGTRRVSAGFGGLSDGTDYHVQLSSYRTDGVSAMNPAQLPNANPDRDGYRNNSFSANVGHSFSADHRLAVSAYASDGENQYDNQFGLPTDVNVNRSKLWKLSATSDNQLSDSWHSKLQIASGVDQYRDYLNGQPVAFFGSPSSLFQTRSNQFTWQNTLRLANDKQLLLGAEALQQNVSTDIVPGYVVSSRQINSLFGGYTGQYDAHQLQFNARRDNNSQYGGANTGLLGYGYSFTDAWRATASYSTAYRAPTFNEQYYPGFGNPALKPEYSRNSEAGVHYHATGQQLDLVYFDNRIRDLIALNAAFLPVNINKARINGVELSYAGHLDNTGIKMALTSQNPRNADTGTPLDRRTKLHGNVGITQQLGDWRVGGEWLYSGTRPDNSNTRTLAAYNVFNLSAGYAFSKELQLSLRLDNITNQNDSNAYGYNPLGRRWFAGINYQP